MLNEFDTVADGGATAAADTVSRSAEDGGAAAGTSVDNDFSDIFGDSPVEPSGGGKKKEKWETVNDYEKDDFMSWLKAHTHAHTRTHAHARTHTHSLTARSH